MPVKVSVLVPICNVEQYLRECLDSAVNQTIDSIEFICIDDGSKDSSGAILDEFAARFPCIKAIHKENEGYGISMNRALDLAEGEYIGILESDDFASPDMYECLYSLAKNNDADAVRSNYYIYTSFPEPHDAKTFFTNECQPYEVYRGRDNDNLFFTPPSIWTSLYRRSFLNENGIRFSETPGASYQDTAFNFKVWATAERVVTTDRAFLHYRCDNEGSSVKSKTKTYYVNHELHEMEKYLEAKPELKSSLATLLPAIKFKTYFWNLNRITPELRPEYYECMIKELFEAKEAGLVDLDRFYEGNKENAKEFFADPQAFFDKRFGASGVKHSIILLLDGTGSSPSRFIKELKEQPEKSFELFCIPSHPNPIKRDRIALEAESDHRIKYIDTRNALLKEFDWGVVQGEYVTVLTPDNTLNENSLSLIEDSCSMNSEIIDSDLEIKDILANLIEGKPIPPVSAPKNFYKDFEASRLSFECGLHLPLFEKAKRVVFSSRTENPQNQNIDRLFAPSKRDYRKFFEEYSQVLNKGVKLYTHYGLDKQFGTFFSQLTVWIPEAYYNLSSLAKSQLGSGYLPSNIQNQTMVPTVSEQGRHSELTIAIIDRGDASSTSACIKSALSQAEINATIMCVSKSKAPLDNEGNSLSVIRTSPNTTTGEMFNLALDHTSTPYVMFVDAQGEFTSSNSAHELLEHARTSNENICVGLQEYPSEPSSEKLRANGNILGLWNTEPQQCKYVDHQFDAGISRCIFKTSFLKDSGIRFVESDCYAERLFLVNALTKAGAFQGVPSLTYRLNSSNSSKPTVKTAEQSKNLIKDLASLLKISSENDLDWVHVSAFDSFTRHSADIEPYLRLTDAFELLIQAQGNINGSLFKKQGRVAEIQPILFPLARISEILNWKSTKEIRMQGDLLSAKNQIKALKKERKAISKKSKALSRQLEEFTNKSNDRANKQTKTSLISKIKRMASLK